MRFAALALFVCGASVAEASGCGGGGDGSTAEPTTAADKTAEPTATADKTAEATATVDGTAEPTGSVAYQIVQGEDVSLGATVRIVYRVSVSGPLSEAEVKAVSEEIIEDTISSQDVNAIGFFFYLPGTDTDGVYTAGKADWAPDGDWAKADTVEAGDYSSHELGAIDIVE